MEKGVQPRDFNSYGSRRGNHEVMIRGTFANIRLRNLLAPGTEGGVTLHLPDEEQMSIYDAAMRYQEEGVPLVVLAGKEYGSGSSRDWAAKGPMLLGVRAVLAESYERIHRANLVGMGILPLELPDGETVESLGLTGHETFDITGLEDAGADGFPREVAVRADDKELTCRLRNRLAPGTEGGVTLHLPDGEQMTIYEAAMRYQQEGVPLVVLAGKEYGSGSSRDWAAKGTRLLGVRAVLAESYERIHRSNLVGMGVLPLQFPEGETADSLGLTGEEQFTITGLAEPLNAGELPREVDVQAGDVSFKARVRIDTPKEADYFRHGGILRYVLRQLLADAA